jgi:hypothetical protein
MSDYENFRQVRWRLDPLSFLGGTQPMIYASRLRAGEDPPAQPGSPAAERWSAERFERYVRHHWTYAQNRAAIWNASPIPWGAT